jgi:hypothetical protein
MLIGGRGSGLGLGFEVLALFADAQCGDGRIGIAKEAVIVGANHRGIIVLEVDGGTEVDRSVQSCCCSGSDAGD